MKKIFLFLPFLFSFSSADESIKTLQQFSAAMLQKLNSMSEGSYTITYSFSEYTDTGKVVIFKSIDKVYYKRNLSDSLSPVIFKDLSENGIWYLDGKNCAVIDSAKKTIHYAKIEANQLMEWRERNYRQNNRLLKILMNPVNFSYYVDKKNWDKITFINDTIYKNTHCYYFKSFVIDTDYVSNIISGPFYNEIFVDKKTMYPIRFIDFQNLEGTASVKEIDLSNITIEKFTTNFFTAPTDFSSYKNYTIISTVEEAEKYEEESLKRQKSDTSKIGQLAKPWQASTLDGKVISSNDFKGQYQLIDFSYTTCFYCVKCIPFLNELANKYSDVRVFWLDAHETNSVIIQSFSKKKNLQFPIYYKAEKAEQDYGVYGNPHLYLVNPEGKIIYYLPGYNEQGEHAIDSLLQVLHKR